LLELALVVPGVVLAVRDRRQSHTPTFAPTRLLGEEAGEELDEMAIARARKHAEALEQRELDPMLRDQVGLLELGGECHDLGIETGRQVDRLVLQALRVAEQGSQLGKRVLAVDAER